MKHNALILVFFILTHNLIAQQQVTNVHSKETDKDSSPSGFVEFNGSIFFRANTEAFGREIWYYKEGENKAQLLKDINIGQENGGFYLLSETSVVLNDTMYFVAIDRDSNGEIWKTDGSPEGTKRVTNFLNFNISKLTLVNDKFYFLIKNETNLQLWKSDGTSEGTVLVKEEMPIWNTPSFQGKCGEYFIFTFQPKGSNYSKVWRSNGTEEGTFPLTEEIDGNGSGLNGTPALSQYVELNNELYFVSRHYLHRTDGTIENTIKVASLDGVYTRLINYSDAIAINDKVYFLFFKIDNKRLFIVESDGTLGGTNIIYDESGERYFMPSNLNANNKNLLFTSSNENGGTSLNSLNLEDFSISYLQELNDSAIAPRGILLSERSQLCKIYKLSNDSFFCAAPIGYRTDKTGWICNLSKKKTTNIKELDNVSDIFIFNNSFFFSKFSEPEGIELWQSDGLSCNTFLVDNINKSKFGVENQKLNFLDSILLFTADNGSYGEELWTYDFSSTKQLKDIRNGSNSSYPNELIEFKNEIYFSATDSIHGFELWKTDATKTGTTIVEDILIGEEAGYPRFLTAYNNYLYFKIFKDYHHLLYRTDGNELEFVYDFGSMETLYYGIKGLFVSGNYLYIHIDRTFEELWRTDGTEEGTVKIHDFYSCENFVDIDGKLFFVSSSLENPELELWTSDGTKEGTKIIKDIGSGYSSSPLDLVNFNKKLVFSAYTIETGREIWVSDGSESGTKQLRDIFIGANNSIDDANFYVFQEELYFTANDGIHGQELWKTDGTNQGTILVKDINPGAEGSFPSEMAKVNDKLYFQAYNPNYGFELWETNGSEIGTELLYDICEGSYSSFPTNIEYHWNNVFFIAESIDNGRQIWKKGDENLSAANLEDKNNELLLYPNPCIDFIYINDECEKMKIFNSIGHLVYYETEIKNRINISYLKDGIYFIQFERDDNVVVKKLIKTSHGF